MQTEKCFYFLINYCVLFILTCGRELLLENVLLAWKAAEGEGKEKESRREKEWKLWITE